MVAAITTLEQEIAHEERRVGLPVGEPLTDSSITRRRVQIEGLLAACAFVALFALLVAGGLIRALAVALAVAFGVYAMEKDRHFRRLASLRDDTRKITLAVAGELMDSGALDPDRELLDLRDGLATAAGRLATGLAGVLPADSARVRLVGPSGEVPIAALRQIATGGTVPDDGDAAAEALRHRAPVRRESIDGRGILVVPMWRGDDLVALLEVVSPPDERYLPKHALIVDAFARGAVAALLATL